MPGLFGYFDPERALAPGTAARMSRALEEPGRAQVIVQRPWGAIGSVDLPQYPAAGEAHAAGAERVFVAHGFVSEGPGAGGSADALAALLCPGVDAERLLAARGHFAAAVLDDAAQSLTLVTDRFGMYPLYVARLGRATLFASELKALLASGQLDAQHDPVAVALLIATGELSGDRTLLRSVRAVPPGALWEMRAEAEARQRYFELELWPDDSLSWGDAVQRAAEALRTAVHRVCAERDAVRVPLSGGLDSRLLAELAAERCAVHSFTFGVPGCRDRRYAAAVSRRIGALAESASFDPLELARRAAEGAWRTEGMFSFTNYHVLPYLDRIAEPPWLVLDGLGGDAILGGTALRLPWLSGPSSRAGTAFWEWRVDSWWKGAPELRARLRSELDAARSEFLAAFERQPGEEGAARVNAFFVENRVRRNNLCGPRLWRARVPTAQPFLDADFVEVMRCVPPRWRYRHRFHVAVLRTLAPRSRSVPWQRTGLPASAPYPLALAALAGQRVADLGARALRLPRPFGSRDALDLAGWLRGPLLPFVRETLLAPRALDRGWLPADVIREAVELHASGAADVSPGLGTCLALELFARQCIDVSPPRPLAAT